VQYGVKLVKGVVKEVLPKEIVLSDDTRVPYGLLVWSTGVGPSDFVKSLNLPKSPGGRYVLRPNDIAVPPCMNE
jgi:NADH:ubiquinone reductase (non-electrogenic)